MKPTHEQWLEALEALTKGRCWVLINDKWDYAPSSSFAEAVGYATAVNEHKTDRECGSYDAVVVAGPIIVWPEAVEGCLVRQPPP